MHRWHRNMQKKICTEKIYVVVYVWLCAQLISEICRPAHDQPWLGLLHKYRLSVWLPTYVATANMTIKTGNKIKKRQRSPGLKDHEKTVLFVPLFQITYVCACYVPYLIAWTTSWFLTTRLGSLSLFTLLNLQFWRIYPSPETICKTLTIPRVSLVSNLKFILPLIAIPELQLPLCYRWWDWCSHSVWSAAASGPCSNPSWAALAAKPQQHHPKFRPTLQHWWPVSMLSLPPPL